MRIIFFGSPASAIFSLKKILEEGHDVPLIVTQADKPSGRGRKLVSSPVKKFAQQSHIPVLQPERIKKDAAAFERIKEINPDLLVVHGYGQIIPGNIIFFPKHNSVNVHFSLLPKYRGASPVQWAILNGEEKTAEFESWMARVVQHEIDHLNGILFIDYLSPIKQKLVLNKFVQV